MSLVLLFSVNHLLYHILSNNETLRWNRELETTFLEQKHICSYPVQTDQLKGTSKKMTFQRTTLFLSPFYIHPSSKCASNSNKVVFPPK